MKALHHGLENTTTTAESGRSRGGRYRFPSSTSSAENGSRSNIEDMEVASLLVGYWHFAVVQLL